MSDTKIFDEVLRTFQEEIDALEKAKKRIYDNFGDRYTNAVKLLSQANKVVVSGVGKSGIIAKKIAATFSSIGVSAIFLHPVEALHGDLGMVQENDMAILLSKSGTTEDIVKLVPFLKMQGAGIISITGNPDSFLARSADVFLDASVEREVCPYNLAPTTSTTLSLVIGDALAIALMQERNVTLESFSRLHPLGQIGRNVTVKVKDIMHKDERLAAVKIGTGLQDAVIEITQKGLGGVCIVNNSNDLVGIITDGDLRRILSKEVDIRTLKVDDVMTKSPIRCSGDAFLGEALAIMEQRESQINILPVVENEKLTGLIRLHDIVKSGI